MSDRSAFLNRIREATSRGRAYRVAVNPLATAEKAYVGGGTDLVAAFLTEWIAVGGRGTRVTGAAAARVFLAQFLADAGDGKPIERVIQWRHPLLERLELPPVYEAAGVTATTWDMLAAAPEETRWTTAFAADLGITSADYAVAETGTLALCSQCDQGRVVSLLPPRYLAILEPSQLVPDLFDLFRALETRKTDLPSNIALVTGPSKTGDIELKLTTGVHGPGNVFVLVVE